jgi:2-C-methyl-D-erythritol 4-phosphate cytidylyltransferase
LIVCTNNGEAFQNSTQKSLLQNKGIKIIESKIKNFVGTNGQIEKIVFEKGERISRKGGFVMPQLIQSSDSGKQLGCQYNPLGGIIVID